MNYKTRDSIKLLIIREIERRNEEIKQLESFDFSDDDLYVYTEWSDSYYPDNPSDNYKSKTVEEAINWLSKQHHPMNFSKCFYHMGLYIDVLDDNICIKTYDAEKLARAKRAEMDYHYEEF